MKKNTNLKNTKSCLMFIYIAVISTISIVSIPIFILNFKNSINNIVKLKEIENFALETYYYESFSTFLNQGRTSAASTTYKFIGKTKGKESIIKASIWYDSNTPKGYIEEFIANNNAKVWYNPKFKTDRAYFQAQYPTKQSFFNHSLISLLIVFFIPLFLIIRLIYLYGGGIFKSSPSQNKQENESH